MDYMLQIGFICQQVKSSPPDQVQKFYSLLFDTQGTLKLWIPSSKKVSSSLDVTLDFVTKTNIQGKLSHLTYNSIRYGGTLTVIGWCSSCLHWTNQCPRSLWQDVHYTCSSTGKALYYTSIELSVQAPPTHVNIDGAWATHVPHFSSNWQELRMLVWSSLSVQSDRKDLHGRSAVFYCTGNIVTYYVMQSGSSSSPKLHKLVLAAKLLELQLGCWIVVV